MPHGVVERADPSPVLVGPAIGRFRDPAGAEAPLAPSFAIHRTLSDQGPIPAGWRARPTFWTDADGKHHVRVETESTTSLYGTGEVAGPLNRRGRRTVQWNTDSFMYDDRTDSLYQSHPWVLGVRQDGSAFGVLVDTTWRVVIDLRAGIELTAEGPTPPVYVIEGPSPRDVARSLAWLIGTAPLPPRWALGYHQCRWSYQPDARVREIASGFRGRRIPCDVIWLDIDYMHGFRCFTFDPTKFPDPGRLNDELHQMGFRSVWMIDPGIKVDPGYAVYDSGREGGHFVLTASGDEYRGQVWPGTCAFPDFTREATRRWWADLYRGFLATGVDGVWNDMNEPAVFDNQFKQVPEDLRHRADPDLGGPGPHARYHNVYGMLMARSTREGFARVRPDRRPFVLTRSSFIGGHRYAATWTGDNMATWDHLRWSIPMVLNLGLSGQPFSGPDIGGFVGNASPQLYARWMGLGAMLPFARCHSVNDSHDHEPWSFGPEVEHACRLAIERRYRLLPYFYTVFHESTETGLPIARPLFYADPADPALRDADDAFLVGDSLLVRAVVSASGECRSPLPAGAWRAFNPLAETHPDLPELRIRAGAIIPMGPVMQHTGERPLDPVTLVVCPDDAGQAAGTLYEDAGEGFGYRDGEYLLTTYRAKRQGDAVVVEVSGSEGNQPRPDRALEVIVVLSDGRTATGYGKDGMAVTVDLPRRAPDRRALSSAARGADIAPPMPAHDITRLTDGRTRSISAENPDGRKAGGAQATPGPDPQLSPAAATLGRGWKVRPCLKNFEPGQTVTLADIQGPGVITHIWCTVLESVHRWVSLRVYYDDQAEPSIAAPLGDFFANGLDGRALINSAVVSVNPKGGMNSYWPMPFRRRIRVEITNDGPSRINEFFYQISYSLQDVADSAGYLHACWRRSLTPRHAPEHVILEGVRGRGHYAGTYLVWNQLSNGWWGEGEVKFFIDGDPPDAPTICGTGTEDYFGGAWGFVMDHASDMRPTPYSTLYLGYPQAVYGATDKRGPIVPAHALYRWHLPDPVRFQRDLRVTVQALGWWPTGQYQPLTDDIASTAYWYQALPGAPLPKLPPLADRLPR